MKKTLAISLCAVMTILAACNEAEIWTPGTGCTDTESRCDGNQLLVCQNAAWIVESNCAADGKICGNDAEGKAVCVAPPAEPCVPSCKDGKVTRCDNEGKATVDTCGETQVCGFDENGAPACVDTAKSCTPMCANGVLTTCDAEMNEVTKSCSDDNKVCGVDEKGALACVEAVVCTFGETNVLVGTKVCDAEGKVMECQADGTMSEGTACTAGVCAEGECVRRACDDVADGKNVCKENKLMVCNDGELVEDTENACGTDTPLCRDGEFECSAYKDCDTIEHGKNGCKDGNIVLCNDGETSVVTDGNCVENEQFCITNPTAEGFICKTPDPTDCAWNNGVVAKNETVCDGNFLKTCSADKDGELSEGVDCATVNNGKPVCDSKLNICRAYLNCGDNGEIVHDSVACNAKGTNKAKCVDGKLVDLTDDACAAVDNANTTCTYDTEATCGFECKPGYFLKNDACEAIVTCDAVKEKYNKDDNTCSCNTDAHWTGTVGSCVCESDYLNIGNACVKKDDNICACDTENGWTGTAGSCTCAEGTKEQEGACVCAEGTKEQDGVCVCDEDNGWVTDELYGGCKPTLVKTMTFGQYEQDTDTSNGKEPITWRILAVKDGKQLIISEKALDVQLYDKTNPTVTWETCTLRVWLNDDFFNAAFSDTEKGKIETSTVPAHVNPNFPVSPGNETTDKIFLLSITEAQTYFTSDADRQCDATRYAVKKGAHVLGSESGLYTSDGTCTDIHCSPYWWLRSPGSRLILVSVVKGDGSIYFEGEIGSATGNAVRPAMWVNF